MNYKRISIDKLNTYPYPNLIAEIIESGYGMHTISDYMGHGNTYDTQELVKKKLDGTCEILVSEAFGLAKYYGVEPEYLFAHTLSVINGKSKAYWRWYDENLRRKEDLKRYSIRYKILNLLEKCSLEQLETLYKKVVEECLNHSKGVITNPLYFQQEDI